MKFYGELLIFLLLFITNLRVFFVKHTNKDPLVSLAPINLFLAIFQVFAWKIDPLTLYALILSVVILITNFHAILRFAARLYIDHYSPLMKFWAVVTLIFSAFGVFFTVLFAPFEINSKAYGVTESQIKLQGSFASGLEPHTIFSKNTANIYEYTMFPELQGKKDIVVFISDKRADTYNYRPYLIRLANSGFTVCSADFYVKDNKWVHNISDSQYLRRTTLLYQSLINEQKFMFKREFYTYNIKQELDHLLPLLTEKYGSQCKFFLISDVMGNTAISDYALTHPDLISGTFNIDSISEYKTPGYGCIEQTEPFVYFLLRKKISRSSDSVKVMVSESKDAIKGAILKK